MNANEEQTKKELSHHLTQTLHQLDDERRARVRAEAKAAHLDSVLDWVIADCLNAGACALCDEIKRRRASFSFIQGGYAHEPIDPGPPLRFNATGVKNEPGG